MTTYQELIFFHFVIYEWNKLDFNIRNIKTLSFRQIFVKFCQASAKRIFNIHNPVSLNFFTRLKVLVTLTVIDLQELGLS